MEEQDKEDLKTGEEETPADADQSEKETAEPEGEGESPKDEVTISKSELEKLQKDAGEKENYRKAVIRLNRSRGRALPESEPEKKPDEGWEQKPPEEDFVTKQELRKRDEISVITKACEDPEIDENWDDIIVFYTPTKDESYAAKLAGILKAHKLWSLDRKLDEVPEKDEGKKVTSDLAAEKGLSKGKEKTPKPPKKSVLPKRQTMEEWY